MSISAQPEDPVEISENLETISPYYDLDEALADEIAEYTAPELDESVPDLDSDPSGEGYNYPTRGPLDVVVSGPLRGGWGPGRWMPSRQAAFTRMVNKYGAQRVVRVPAVAGRWAFLIKKLRVA